MIDVVLFDLDGTLADTATDLGAALNKLLVEEGRSALPLAMIRPHVSNGARGLLKLGFKLSPEDDAYIAMSQRFLTHYSAAICVGTQLFDGISELLDTLEQKGHRWGVITNKHSRFTTPVMEQLGLTQRAACIISGDTAARPKPAPDPLLLACEQIGVSPQQCLYVGDDLRDIEAGRAANMGTVAVAWGYLGESKPIEKWNADHIIQTPAEILGLLQC